MTLIADIFRKLRTLKNVTTYISEESRFTGSFDRQHVNKAQTLLQSERQHHYHI